MKLLFLISKLLSLLQAIRDNVWEPSALLFKVWSVDRRHHGHPETCEEMRSHRSQSRLNELESDSKISRRVVGPLKFEKQHFNLPKPSFTEQLLGATLMQSSRTTFAESEIVASQTIPLIV